MTLDPIASCANWHPNQPSQIRLTSHTGPLGKPFQRRHCALCRELYAKHRHQGRVTSRVLEPYGIALGVVRLGWAVPERVERAP